MGRQTPALKKIRSALKLDQFPPGVRRVVVGIVGGTVVLIGIALVVLPGPAFIVIPIGIAILASEFAWAGKLTVRARWAFRHLRTKYRRWRTQRVAGH